MIDAVFAHRFVLRRHDGTRLLADLGPKGAETFRLVEGIEVSIEGVMMPSELAGLFGVVAVVVADVMMGTCRFDLAQGMVAPLAVGVGAALVKRVSGYGVQGCGYPAGFLLPATAALIAFAHFRRETKDAEVTVWPKICSSTPISAIST